MSELSVATFDYSVIEDKDTRSKLQYFEGRVMKLRDAAGRAVLDLGRELSEVQQLLSNHSDGVFVAWLDVACGFSRSSAYRYISAWHTFGSFPTVGKLEDTAMYRLAENGTPKSAVTEAKKLADKGVYVSSKLAAQIIEKHTTKPAASNGKHSHKVAGSGSRDTENRTEAVATTFDPCVQHTWVSDGNGQRYCERCKEDEPKPPPAKGREKVNAVKLVDELFRSHFSGAAGLPQMIDRIAEVNGGKGAQHKAADAALNALIGALKQMKEGKR